MSGFKSGNLVSVGRDFLILATKEPAKQQANKNDGRRGQFGKSKNKPGAENNADI
jgi:hypothetical protein